MREKGKVKKGRKEMQGKRKDEGAQKRTMHEEGEKKREDKDERGGREK